MASKTFIFGILVLSVRYSSFSYLKTMKRISLSFISILFFTSFHKFPETTTWIRINQLGYTPKGIKVAVFCSKENEIVKTFQLVDAHTNKIVFSSVPGKAFGSYGPFTQTCRLNFSSFNKPG